jgi:hypothetical protein
MNEPSTSMKACLFSALEELAGARPYFSFSMVRKSLENSALAAKPALLREYLSEAMEKKVIRSIRRTFDPATEPRVENVLVDLMLENSRLHLMDEGERKEMSRKLLTTNRVEIATLFARLRDHKRNLADLAGFAEQPIIAEK